MPGIGYILLTKVVPQKPQTSQVITKAFGGSPQPIHKALLSKTVLTEVITHRSRVLTSVHGARKFSAGYQKERVIINYHYLQTLCYNSDLPPRYTVLQCKSGTNVVGVTYHFFKKLDLSLIHEVGHC